MKGPFSVLLYILSDMFSFDLSETKRFALLKHEFPQGSSRATHLDLMLEQTDSLATWAIEKIPELHQSVKAQRLPNHRLQYLDYEGPISGDRGFVRRLDSGLFDLISCENTSLTIRLAGTNVCGVFKCSVLGNDQCGWAIVRLEDFAKR